MHFGAIHCKSVKVLYTCTRCPCNIFITFFWSADSVRAVSSSRGSRQSQTIKYISCILKPISSADWTLILTSITAVLDTTHFVANVYQHPCHLRQIDREQVDYFWRQVLRSPRYFLSINPNPTLNVCVCKPYIQGCGLGPIALVSRLPRSGLDFSLKAYLMFKHQY